ncbi:hypothetical protein MG293_003862 [Ovis ammon polii]|uniref:Uncharacterized protein n=1 Tax=Ovis ammon polii TaxID=230172 RepID=A0AAD4UIR8_OVIAM|nr:hypothetical protein MG293_003862 [Ovis ammon polii]
MKESEQESYGSNTYSYPILLPAAFGPMPTLTSLFHFLVDEIAPNSGNMHNQKTVHRHLLASINLPMHFCATSHQSALHLSSLSNEVNIEDRKGLQPTVSIASEASDDARLLKLRDLSAAGVLEMLIDIERCTVSSQLVSEDKRCQKNQSAKMDLMILQDNDYIKPSEILNFKAADSSPKDEKTVNAFVNPDLKILFNSSSDFKSAHYKEETLLSHDQTWLFYYSQCLQIMVQCYPSVTFRVAENEGYSLVAVHGLLIAVASRSLRSTGSGVCGLR